MGLNYLNLDARTRVLMLEEIDSDNNSGRLFTSDRLSETGRNDYPALLRDAAQSRDDSWLAMQLKLNSRLNAMEQKRKPTGGFYMARVPVIAAETMAEGEFNRFYIRGLCRRAIEGGMTEVEVYRAKPVEKPRTESMAKIGARVSATALLADLRDNIGVDTALGLPSGPNSGLSIKLVS